MAYQPAVRGHCGCLREWFAMQGIRMTRMLHLFNMGFAWACLPIPAIIRIAPIAFKKTFKATVKKTVKTIYFRALR